MMQLWNKLKIKENKNHQSYQLYDQISYEEIDDAANYSLRDIPENALYETNKAKADRLANKRMFKMTSKSYQADASGIRIQAIDRGDLDNLRQRSGYLHIAAIQIMVRFLGNAGLDIPLKIAIRDERLIKPKDTILGLLASNLYTGAVRTDMHLNLLLDAKDANLEDALTILVIPQVEMKEGSSSIVVTTKMYSTWLAGENPFRKMDQVFNTENAKKGKAIVLRTKSTDISKMPQPIPIEELSWDLEFKFPREIQTHKPKVAVETEYELTTKDNFIIKLKAPERRSTSSRIEGDYFSDLFRAKPRSSLAEKSEEDE